jgi:glutamine amidotransferase-like uncharacterized protein
MRITIKIYLVIITTLVLMAAVYYQYYTNKPNKQVIYIYNDEGASAESVSHTKAFFQAMAANNYVVKYLKTEELLKASWVKDAALFVMPGGADMPYVKKLRGTGDEIIRDYIKKGGSFLGICAGSYYASSFIEFDKGGTNEVVGERYLKLFNGNAIGPALAKYSYDTNKGSKAARITCGNDQLAVFYNGGPYFEMPHNTTAKVICTYSDKNNLPAVLHSKYGKGKVLLSAIHFEYNPAMLNHNDKYYQDIIQTLNYENNNRIYFGKKMLDLLDIRTK